jgi:hypothetical protein
MEVATIETANTVTPYRGTSGDRRIVVSACSADTTCDCDSPYPFRHGYTYRTWIAIISSMADALTIPLPNQVMLRLEERASAQGVDVVTLAGRVLRREAARPLLDEILKPVRDAFAASGMSDDELAELLEFEKHAMRGVPYEPK